MIEQRTGLDLDVKERRLLDHALGGGPDRALTKRQIVGAVLGVAVIVLLTVVYVVAIPAEWHESEWLAGVKSLLLPLVLLAVIYRGTIGSRHEVRLIRKCCDRILALQEGNPPATPSGTD